jgi:hypothetical protein
MAKRRGEEGRREEMNVLPVRSFLVLSPHHRKNTEKIANVFADVLGAGVTAPQRCGRSPGNSNSYLFPM